MYSYIKGILIKRTDDIVVIENNDIGYEIKCPFAISSKLGHEGEKTTIWLYQSVKEDDISLYGFSGPEQKDMFLLLIDNVKGVGPKVAQSICAQIEPDRLALAVLSGDIQALTGVKGLGKKGAERIVLELKDKLKNVSSAGKAASPVTSGVAADAVEALTVLGYKEADAAAAVNAAYEDDISLQDLIRKALRSLAR
ncbi:MAG: Holliday junction branch migration protein RuvA [Clostridiales bacterium]|nr:Holliday junction branch migration protein RuvA [Clostridiales bacterium]